MPPALRDSRADFFGKRLSVNHKSRAKRCAWWGKPRSNAMTFAGRLSVVTAYLAMAFVGAIVLGMI